LGGAALFTASHEEAAPILDMLIEFGVSHRDSAAGYGVPEVRLVVGVGQHATSKPGRSHDFIGRSALEAELQRGPQRSLVYLAIDPDPDEPADVLGDVVGWVTSGADAHCSGVSLAFGYVPAELAAPGTPGEQWGRFEVEIIGHRRPACLLTEPVLDSAGTGMRAYGVLP
jgi:glycine cleavage system aminomethyltransferase T